MTSEPEREQFSEDSSAEDLRALYQRLAPPPLADAASDADPKTARVVRWMQDAWQGLAVPPARVPLAPRLARGRAAPRLRVLAAAAAVLAVAGAALAWRALARDAGSAALPSKSQSIANAAPAGAESHVEVIAIADRLELRSGPVRLVLLEPPSSTPHTEANEPTTTGG